MANPEAAVYQGKQETTVFSKKNVGRALEFGGAVLGIVELLDFSVVPALVGGAIYLLGKLIENSGQSGGTQH